MKSAKVTADFQSKHMEYTKKIHVPLFKVFK